MRIDDVHELSLAVLSLALFLRNNLLHAGLLYFTAVVLPLSAC